jgi:hypothetical protein
LVERVHEGVGDRDRDVEVRDAAVELAVDELEHVGMVDAQDAHVGAAPRARPASPPRCAVEHLEEGHRAGGAPARGGHDVSFGRRREKAKPVPPPDLWMMAAALTESKISSIESPTGST